MTLEEVELERRVRERTAHLEAANRELEAFVSSVSHDLRGPLRSILGFTRIVIEEHGGELSSDAAVCLNRAAASAAQMSGMIEGLLRLSRTGQKELLKSTVDVGRLARKTIQRLRREDPERHVEFVVQEPLIALGDEMLLGIALENLLSNAWKFTRDLPGARIEFGSLPREGRSVYFVRDNGVGFSESEAHRLFKPFQRLHRQEDFPGVGIGLATVARIVARHGGRIWFEAAVGAGATFYFTL